MSSALDTLPGAERALVRRSAPPRGSDAMKAVLTDERFSHPDWIFERKLDGIRCIAIRQGDGVRLLSRNDLSLDQRYPELAETLAGERCESFAVDGEVVAFDGAQTSFSLLSQRGQRRVRVFLYAFDLLWLDGHDLRRLPLRSRKRLLREALDFRGDLRLTPHRNERGEELYAEACSKGWEGLIAKRADSPYSGARSKNWLKFKCDRSQELVIGGYTAPKGSREDLGALLTGYYDGGELRYAGKVGTGFDGATLKDLAARMRPLRRSDPPFADAGEIKDRTATWVDPELVAQIGFAEWTRHARLRHPRFLGLRFDKPAAKVVREA